MVVKRIRLTEREYDIVTMLNRKNEEIAEELGLTLNTVKFYYKRISGKFGVNSRSAVIIRALKLGLVELEAFTF